MSGGGGGGGFSLNVLPWMNTSTGKAYSSKATISNFFNPGSFGGVFGAGQWTGKDAPKSPDDTSVAVPETVGETAAEAKAKADERARAERQARLRSQNRSKTVYSSPLGISGEAQTANKALLGR